MPLFLVQLRKAINTSGIAYKWSNRYFTDQPDITGALGQGLGWWDTYERTFHGELAFCYEIYANQVGDAPFTPGSILAVPLAIQRGALPQQATGSTTTLLPSFTVARVDFPVFNSRPSRKFYRIPLREDLVESAQLTPAYTATLSAGATGLAGEPSMRDVDGQSFQGSASVRGVTSRRLGRDAFQGIPASPPFG